jgi:hypothetical protein
MRKTPLEDWDSEVVEATDGNEGLRPFWQPVLNCISNRYTVIP